MRERAHNDMPSRFAACTSMSLPATLATIFPSTNTFLNQGQSHGRTNFQHQQQSKSFTETALRTDFCYMHSKVQHRERSPQHTADEDFEQVMRAKMSRMKRRPSAKCFWNPELRQVHNKIRQQHQSWVTCMPRFVADTQMSRLMLHKSCHDTCLHNNLGRMHNKIWHTLHKTEKSACLRGKCLSAHLAPPHAQHNPTQAAQVITKYLSHTKLRHMHTDTLTKT